MTYQLKPETFSRFYQLVIFSKKKNGDARFLDNRNYSFMKFTLCFFLFFSLANIKASFAQEESQLLKNGTKVLFVGNSHVGSEGGLQNHFRRTVATAKPALKIETGWIGMYDKPTLSEMLTDELMERIKVGDDSLLVVSSGSIEAMNKFARLIQDAGKKMVVYATWADNPFLDGNDMNGFRQQTTESIQQVQDFEKETGIPVVPSGLIYYDLLVDPVPFWNLRKDYLFVPGSSVQNDLGTLVNVAAVYAVTTGKSPVGLSFWNPFPEELVKAVQERVWKIVQDWQAGKAEVKPIPDEYGEPKWPALIQNDDHIFYVGNSFIGTEGGLDNHFKRMVQEMDPPLEIHNKSMIFWGQGLNRMYTDEVVKEINTGDNDLVVVTSGPTDLLKKFHDTITEAGSKMMVHMTWGLNPTLKDNDLNAYREQVVKIVDSMKEFEEESQVPVAPCGLVFYDLVVDPPKVPGLRQDWVYMVENIHQNHIGTMANAATHYAVMTGRSPIGLPMWDPFPPELVRAVQERAWQIVKDWKAGKTVIKPASGGNDFNSWMERMRKNVKWVHPEVGQMPGLSHHVLQSKAMGHEVGYAVWTPPGYSKSTKKHYPVIYFLHGAGGNESSDAAGFSGRVAKAIENKILPEVICVFPNGGMSFYRGEVEQMIIEELIPTIDHEYRTIAKPASRALAGFSMGGFGSVNLSVMHPHLFCAAGSMGGGLWGTDESFQQSIKDAMPVWKESNYGFFLVNGDNDRPDAFDEFSKTLNENDIENQIIILPDTKHNLGMYFDKSSNRLFEFLGNHLKK